MPVLRVLFAFLSFPLDISPYLSQHVDCQWKDPLRSRSQVNFRFYKVKEPVRFATVRRPFTCLTLHLTPSTFPLFVCLPQNMPFPMQNQKCYLYTLRAASKWGRWDVIEGLLKDMHQLGVGLVRLETPDSLPEGWGGLNNDSTVMSSECYTPLVEAYAQASMWERTIETYRKGFGLRHGRVEVVNYRVRGDDTGREGGHYLYGRRIPGICAQYWGGSTLTRGQTHLYQLLHVRGA